jgi:hypothetical protein
MHDDEALEILEELIGATALSDQWVAGEMVSIARELEHAAQRIPINPDAIIRNVTRLKTLVRMRFGASIRSAMLATRPQR